MALTILSALSTQLSATEHTVAQLAEGVRITVIPDGEFAAADGRPASIKGSKVKRWRMSAAIAASVIAQIRSRDNQELVLDYEHQTMLAASNGKPAPAAGWMSDFRYEAGKGLTALVRYTAEAAAFVASGAYRYISPVFFFDHGTGDLTALANAALTNNPALDNLTATALTHFYGAMGSPTSHHSNQGSNMELAVALRAALGVSQDADESSLVAAVSALRAKSGEAPDPTKYVALTVLTSEQTAHATTKQELVKLRGEVNTGEVVALIADAKKAGAPITDEFAAHLTALGCDNLAMCKEMIASLPKVKALDGSMQTDGGKGAPGAVDGSSVVALTQSQREMAKTIGVSEDAYAASIKASRESGLTI